MPEDNRNIIDSSGEDETLAGTGNADTFVFGPGDGSDTITGFTNGQDIIDLRAFPIPGFADLTITSNDNGVTIDLTAYGGGTILLQGFDVDDLDAADFVFPMVGFNVHGSNTDDDFIHGTDQDNHLLGNRGDDTIYGGAGDDTLTGGAGDDTFVYHRNSGADVITDFTNGEDVIDLTQFSGISSFSDLTFTSDDNGVTIDLTAHGGGTILLKGFDVDDLNATDFVFPTVGTAGEDTIEGDEGDNWIYGQAGDDTLYGGDGTDKLRGGVGDDTLYGGEGRDSLYGGDSGLAYDFSYDSGNDTMYGGADNDSMWGEGGDDAMYGGADNDSLYGGTGDDTLDGGEGEDLLMGGRGADTLHGGEGDDRLYGDRGADTLDGGSGDDSLTGGKGADTFVFAADHGDDTITDFTDGKDLIDLSQLSAIAGFDDLTITAEGEDAVIDLSAHGGGTIRLKDFSIDDLDEADFVFAEAPDNSPIDRTNLIDGTGPVELGDITAHSGTGSVEGDVNGGSDVNDYFLFTLSESKTVSFALGSLEFDADLEIHSEGGEVLFSSAQSGADGEQIEQTLKAGTYYVRVEAKEEGENNYVLNYSIESTDGSGATDDTLTGGAGADTFVFGPNHGADTITDFTDGEDAIDLTALTDVTGFGDLSITADGSNAVIDLSAHGGGSITLKNVAVDDLDAGDFTFYEAPVEPEVEGI